MRPRWSDGGRSTLVALVAVLGCVELLGMASCLVPDADYCAYVYGDGSCPASRGTCVLAKEKAPHEGINDGCSADVPEGFVHAAYGLPVMVTAPPDDREDPRSVEGVLAKLGYGGCGTEEELAAHFEPVIDGVARVRRHLEERGHTRRAAFALTDGHVEAIGAFNDAVAAWVDACGSDGTGTDTVGTSIGGEETGTGTTEPSTTGGTPCVGDEMCSGDTPFCNLDTGECVPCDGMPDPNAACAGLEMGTPVCLDTMCVQCTAEVPDACTGAPPVCDDATNTCVHCTEHDQCGEAACNLFTGECLPPDAVVHVGPMGFDFTTIGAAVASFADGAEGTIVVHAGVGSYNESVAVDGDRVLAFLAAEMGMGVEPPNWIRTSGSTPQLTVSGVGTVVLMDGIRIGDHASAIPSGFRQAGGRAWLDRARVVQNTGGGILTTGGDLVLRNCFVGGDVNDVNALEANGATVTVSYTTLAAGFGASTALACDATAMVTMRNSLLVSRSGSDEVACDGVIIEHSAAELSLGGTNTALPVMSTNWFSSYGSGDFHLAIAHPVAIDTAAERQPGDPSTDIDGDARPAEGSPDHAGADIP